MKPAARLITTAWGDGYVNNLLTLTLPALLAPGNLPALAEHFSCEFILVTEERHFEKIRTSGVWQRVGEYCQNRLLPVDDLVGVSNHYGISLTYALLRGIEDLGERMTEVYLLFLNADFILADGSYRSLAARMLAGERLVHAPSYCVLQHAVLTTLRSNLYQHQSASIELSPRDMASIILAYRHYTIRAKTVNQRLFRMHRQDQFYWQVDNHTLLGRQLPISLVCMKPEREIRDLHTFWDYGVVSEFCPTTKPCILSDSDEFLMMELREAGTFRELFRLGWASASEIAADLSTYTTKDQREHGLYTLVLHDQDLSAGVDEAKKQLDAFVNHIYRELSPNPSSHLNHPYWTQCYWTFQHRRAEYLKAKAAPPPPPVTPNIEEKPSGGNTVVAPAKPGVLRQLRSSMASVLPAALGAVELWHGRLFGRIPFVTRFHPYHALLRPALDSLKRSLSKPGRQVLTLATKPGPLTTYVRSYAKAGHSITDGSAMLPDDPSGEDAVMALPKGSIDLCVLEVDLTDMLKFERMFERIGPLMRPGGDIVVFCLNHQLANLQGAQTAIIQQALAPVGQSQITFAGTSWTKSALNLYRIGADLRSRYGGLGGLAQVGLTLCALPLSYIGNAIAQRSVDFVMPKHCLSLTIEYHLF